MWRTERTAEGLLRAEKPHLVSDALHDELVASGAGVSLEPRKPERAVPKDRPERRAGRKR